MEVLDGLSAHADADELMAWLRQSDRLPREVFVTHGEPTRSDALCLRIQLETGCRARVPEHGEEVELR